MIAIDDNFKISENGGTGNATIFVSATDKNLFSTASTQIEVSSSVGNIKRYVTLNKKAAHGYMYTPVEWVSNENLNSDCWIDLGYVWNNNSRAQFKCEYGTSDGNEWFGERITNWNPVGPVDDDGDLRWMYNNSIGRLMWDVPSGKRVEKTNYTLSNPFELEIGNFYIKNLQTGSNLVTGSTYNVSRTNTVGLFSASGSGGAIDKIKFYYIKIYEGNTLIMDIIPVLDKDNIPCFFDKVTSQFYYYKVNGEPSTGLTAGNAIQQLDYLQGDGTDYVDIGYVPNASTSIELDFEGNSGDLFGATNRGASNGMFGYFGGGSWNWRYAYRYGDFPQSTFSGRALYKMTPSGDYVNNVQKNSWSGSWSNISASFYIFGIHRESTGLSGAVFNGKIYGVKIFEGDTLVREYIPAKIGSKKGFYDKVLGNFYPSNSNSLIDGNILGNLTVSVIYDESDITISNDTPSTAITYGNTFSLGASTTPTGATLSYSSSDTSIATVDSNGVVTAVAEGTAIITITAQGFQDNTNHIYYNTTSKTVSVECAVIAYMYTPVEWVSNENINLGTIDLGYTIKTNTRMQFKVDYVTKVGDCLIGEENTNSTNNYRWFSVGNKMYYDINAQRLEPTWSATSGEFELGNYYIKDLATGSNMASTNSWSGTRTSTLRIFAPRSQGEDKGRFYYFKIYEDDTLIMDIIPVLDKDNIPCFFDKVGEQFYYYKVNGEPSTGLTAGSAIQELDYLQGDGTDYVVLDYIPSTTTRIEVDCSGRPASTPSSGAGAGTVMGCEIWNSSQPYGAQGGISIVFPGAGGVSFHYGTLSYANKTSQKIIERGVFKLDGSAAYIDDFKVADVTTSFVTQGGPFALFNSLIYNSSNGTTFPISNIYSDAYYEGKIYGVKIYENNVLVRDYVPCAGTSTRGFYDRISGNYLTSVNGSLITGTKVQDIVVIKGYTQSDITISNNTPSTAITYGNTFSLGASTTPTGATLSYSSSDTSIATVDSNGVVTAVGKGNATITITAQGFNDDVNKVHYNTTSKTVSVECAYQSQQIVITNSTPSEAINPNDTFDLNASTTPAGITLTYSSSDTSVATVNSNGVITGVATGTTTITITAQGFDDDINKVHYNTTSKTVSVEVQEATPSGWDDDFLTIEALNPSTTVQLKNPLKKNIWYRKDNQTEYTKIPTGDTPITIENANGYIKLYGDNEGVGEYSYNYSFIIACQNNCNCYGKVTSLLSSGCPETISSIDTFGNLFYQSRIVDASGLILPNNVTEECYYGMFDGCTSLTQAPNLLATTLVEYCYSTMFNGCENLSTVNLYYAGSAPTISQGCFVDWLENAGGTGCTIYAPSDALWSSSDRTMYIPSNCIVEKTLQPSSAIYWLDEGDVDSIDDNHLTTISAQTKNVYFYVNKEKINNERWLICNNKSQPIDGGNSLTSTFTIQNIYNPDGSKNSELYAKWLQTNYVDASYFPSSGKYRITSQFKTVMFAQKSRDNLYIYRI